MPKELDFAYKYPFSSEAKRIVEGQESKINRKYLDMAAKQINNALAGSLAHKEINMDSIKLDYVMTYLYSRLLLSAVRRWDIIKSYALAEAKRSAEILPVSEDSDITRVAAELGIGLYSSFPEMKRNSRKDEFAMNFVDYINNTPRDQSFGLVNQRLSNGAVLLNKRQLSKIMERAIEAEISKGLPIKSADLPKEIIDYSKTLRFKTIQKEGRAAKGSEAWIEKLLQTPIADVRHRTVNLILAPYLVNTKGIDVAEAARMIVEYIEKCKLIDPNTKINERYIEYQCGYAKRKGLRPLSIGRAKELLGEQIDFDGK